MTPSALERLIEAAKGVLLHWDHPSNPKYNAIELEVEELRRSLAAYEAKPVPEVERVEIGGGGSPGRRVRSKNEREDRALDLDGRHRTPGQGLGVQAVTPPAPPTKGPWRVGFSDGSGANPECGIYIVTEAEEYWPNIGRLPVKTIVGGGCSDCYGGVRTLEDARLIASAPALREALEMALPELVDWADQLQGRVGREDVLKVIAAARKALGRE